VGATLLSLKLPERLAGSKPIKTLDAAEKQAVSYCIPLWLRDEQIKLAIARVAGRIQAYEGIPRTESIAVVCYGPSLNDTWEKIKDFKHVITCSGAHRFLVDRGIVPTYHIEVDPRAHKVELIGPPDPAVEYLIASTCHPAVFDHLEGMNVKLWHVFDSQEEALRTLPRGEWALTGGCSVGLRALGIARFLGFVDLHVFGMDGSEGDSGKHAAEHPSQPKNHSVCEYDGVTYKTTPAMLEAARSTWHELDQMPGVRATFYGEGLVQHMARNYKPNPIAKEKSAPGLRKPELISAEYADLNRKLHHDNLAYGVGGGKHADTVLKLAAAIKTTSILDYGCGKGYLAKAIPFPIWEYDPAVPGKEECPRPADLVVSTDVLEHIEPDRLVYVLDDLRRVTRKVAYLVIHTGPAQKALADGRNAHLIQQGAKWWTKRLSKFFKVGKVWKVGAELHVVVGRK
jgi:uncharacterized Rossmann fold enzyme